MPDFSHQDLIYFCVFLWFAFIVFLLDFGRRTEKRRKQEEAWKKHVDTAVNITRPKK